MLVIVLAVAAIWFTTSRPQLPRVETAPVRVVGDRPGGARRAPGAKINEAEAMQILRRALTTRADNPIKTDCLAIMSQGHDGSAYKLTAFDRCQSTKLGHWRVDAQTRSISRE